MYFMVNDIKSDLKLPTLISTIGDVAYDLMVNLCSPKKPADMKYEEVVSIMQKHLQPTPSILAERYKFRQYRQSQGLSVAQYVEQLKKLSRFCDFGTSLQENMRDQFVCGLLCDGIRQRLFAEDKVVDFTQAVSMALSLEAAERDALAVDAGVTSSSGVKQNIREGAPVNKLTLNGCMACGDFRHNIKECKFRDYVCSRCNEMGHLRRMCSSQGAIELPPGNGAFGSHTAGNGGTASFRAQSRHGSSGSGARGRMHATGASARAVAGASGNGATSWKGAPRTTSRARGAAGGRSFGRRKPVYWLEEDSYQSDMGSDDQEPMFQMSLDKYKPVSLPVSINDQILNMEIDTGSALSCISDKEYRLRFKELPLEPCNLILKFYDGSKIRPLGIIKVEVKYHNICKLLDLYVISKGTTNLLGRQWLAELKMSIPKISVNNIEPSEKLKLDKNYCLRNIFSRCKEIFESGLGAYTGERARLRVRPGAVPVFRRARPLPYALRERVDAELDAMLCAGVIEPVEHSDWATPLVIVHKPDGSLRLCADYKATLNPVLLVDKYPVPKIEDLFTELSGSQYFTKIDLSQAYNQILLSEDGENDSTGLTVINTHRGLFKYKRLVYGLASSPGIFQRLMSNMLKDIPNVTVF